ncbi:MAG: DUF503 domain-containing protein [Planctomycetota bacterium]|nr:DUF503 domain-containing protein [Planctomycetota bacterium]
MVIGILQFELLIPGATSIKDKRRVVSSLKDRLHREHQVSVAEVGLQDSMSASRLALAMVGTDGRYVGQVLDRITAKLRALHDAELGDCAREVLRDPQGEAASEGGADEPAVWPQDPQLASEMLRRGESAGDHP